MKFLYLVLLMSMASIANASCLDEVASFAEKICGEIQNRGMGTLTEANGELKADVSGIVRKVVGEAGGGINVKHLEDSYENVLRKDLANELFNVRECRVKMVEVGREEACTKQATSTLSRTCKYTSGPKAGQKQYFPPHIPIITAQIGQPCGDGMGNFGVAVADEQ